MTDNISIYRTFEISLEYISPGRNQMNRAIKEINQ